MEITFRIVHCDYFLKFYQRNRLNENFILMGFKSKLRKISIGYINREDIKLFVFLKFRVKSECLRVTNESNI